MAGNGEGEGANDETSSEQRYANEEANWTESIRTNNANNNPQCSYKGPEKPNRDWVDYATLFALIAAFVAAAVLAWLTSCAIKNASDDATAQRTIAINTEQRQLRAYVGVQGMRLSAKKVAHQLPGVSEGKPSYVYPYTLIVTLKNTGATPAYFVSDGFQVVPAPFGSGVPPFVASLDLTQGALDSDSISAERGSTTLGRDESFDAIHRLTAEKYGWFGAVSHLKVDVWIVGRIMFCDIYQRRWEREYSYLYDPFGTHTPFASMAVRGDERQLGKCKGPTE